MNSENKYKDELRKLYNQISTETKEFDEDTLEHNYKKYQESKEDLSDVEHKIKLKETQIKQWKKSLEEVKEHEFDEDCQLSSQQQQQQTSSIGRRPIVQWIKKPGRPLGFGLGRERCREIHGHY